MSDSIDVFLERNLEHAKESAQEQEPIASHSQGVLLNQVTVYDWKKEPFEYTEADHALLDSLGET